MFVLKIDKIWRWHLRTQICNSHLLIGETVRFWIGLSPERLAPTLTLYSVFYDTHSYKLFVLNMVYPCQLALSLTNLPMLISYFSFGRGKQFSRKTTYMWGGFSFFFFFFFLLLCGIRNIKMYFFHQGLYLIPFQI